MKTVQKICAIALLSVLMLTLFGCGEKKTAKSDYENWFVNGFEPAYASYIASGKAENAPSTDLSLLIASDDYVKEIFRFIKDGTKPIAATITEKDGVYTYAYGTFWQVVEFSAEKTAMKITMHQSDISEDRIEFIAIFAQKGNNYYLQYLAPDFNDYAEVKFNEKGGKALRRGDLSALPYDIFSEDIPSGFAKEK
ncbi:MAG TPA: hypothetical protein DDY98_02670 [Ruminococcaceae bacterium]|nr:hypothetical protein [Oscillospiraceae bacterium]